jgi:hypothetical protein
MTTFNITNIAPNLKDMTMTVFYQFSNGDVFSNTVPATTPVPEILQWGQEKCVWFDEREVKIAEIKRQIEEEEALKLLENQPVVEEEVTE